MNGTEVLEETRGRGINLPVVILARHVDVYVGYLRKKLGDRRIATVRGMGYRFDAAT